MQGRERKVTLTPFSLTRASLRRRLLLAPLAGHKGRSSLSVVAIALGGALGDAVQLINQVAVNEFSQAVQALSGQADLVIRGSRSGFDEALYPVVAQMPGGAGARPGLGLDGGGTDKGGAPRRARTDQPQRSALARRPVQPAFRSSPPPRAEGGGSGPGGRWQRRAQRE